MDNVITNGEDMKVKNSNKKNVTDMAGYRQADCGWSLEGWEKNS